MQTHIPKSQSQICPRIPKPKTSSFDSKAGPAIQGKKENKKSER